MSRHTLSDGQTPDTRITDALYNAHCPDLAPPAPLVGRWYRHQISWHNFALLYTEYLTNNLRAGEAIERLIQHAQEQTVTVLCIEVEPTQCHRRLLLEHIGSICPDLEIEIA